MLTLLDRMTVAYAVVAAVASAWRWTGERSALLVAAHAVLVGAVLLMPHARRAGAVGRALGDWYPLLVVPGLYTAVGLVNVAGGRAHDALVQDWERALFGAQPSREWIRAQPAPWLSWTLHTGYLAFYAVVIGAPLALWARGRRAGMRRVLTRMMAAVYVCYVAFLLFPVTGPRYAFPPADNAATATAAARLTRAVLDSFAAWGTAFPSSHVAVCATATLAALAEWRALGLVLMVPTALLIPATVYGQFHYVVDVLAGLAVAAAVSAALRDG